VSKAVAYRTILVSLNNAERAPVVLEAGVMVANEHDAHLTVLFVVPGVHVHPGAALPMVTDIHKSHRQHFREKGKRVEALLNDRTRQEGLVGEWHTIDVESGLVADTILDRAHCADLVVAGQPDPESDIVNVPGLPECLLMESGRPVLLIPAAGTAPKTLGERVTVAWNSSRESARAVYDALPFLVGAKRVNVLCIDSAGKDPPASAEISATLARHGAKVEVNRSVNTPLAAGDELLSRAIDYRADLLVMGGSGRSRVREFVFGGATRYILRHMTLPVLMSH